MRSALAGLAAGLMTTQEAARLLDAAIARHLAG